jgi:hypothetical protein
MELGYWDTASCTATQEHPSILWNPCSQEPSASLYPEPYQSNPHHPIPYILRCISILSTHLCFDFPSGSFLLVFPISDVHSLSTLFVLHALPSSSFSTHHSNYTWRRVQVMNLLIKQFPPTSCHLSRFLVCSLISLFRNKKFREELSTFLCYETRAAQKTLRPTILLLRTHSLQRLTIETFSQDSGRTLVRAEYRYPKCISTDCK